MMIMCADYEDGDDDAYSYQNHDLKDTEERCNGSAWDEMAHPEPTWQPYCASFVPHCAASWCKQRLLQKSAGSPACLICVTIGKWPLLSY
eukprot:1882983-Amphidinium_carterae.2